MTVKNIVETAAVFLGKGNVTEYLSGSGENYGDAISQTDVLVRGANVILNELAWSFIPMVKSKTVVTEDGIIGYSVLGENATEILEVTDGLGVPVYYQSDENEIKTSCGEVIIRFRYLPPNYGMTDVIGYTEKDIPTRIIAYGVAAEACLAERNFEESVMWRKRFTDALSLYVFPKNKIIKRRSWV